MIAVFAPALILEVFTIYFVIKTTVLQMSINFLSYFDFTLWNVFLVVPTFAAIHIGSRTSREGKEICKMAGKFSSSCNDDSTMIRVNFI